MFEVKYDILWSLNTLFLFIKSSVKEILNSNGFTTLHFILFDKKVDLKNFSFYL